MRKEEFTVEREDGELIRGDLRLPDGEPPGSAVVVVHGFKGFKDWGFFPHVAEVLAAAGHAVVSFNFSRNGIGDDRTRFTELEAFARNTLSRELDEVRRVVTHVREGGLLPGRPDRVGLLGHSRGGGVAIVAARSVVNVDALVTWAAVATFDRWTAERKEAWRREGRIHAVNARTGQQMPMDVSYLEDFEANRDRLDVEAAAAALTVPWLIVHGTGDETVPFDEARRLAAANAAARFEAVRDAGHTFGARHPFEGSTPEFERALGATRDHFRAHLAAGVAAQGGLAPGAGSDVTLSP